MADEDDLNRLIQDVNNNDDRQQCFQELLRRWIENQHRYSLDDNTQQIQIVGHTHAEIDAHFASTLYGLTPDGDGVLEDNRGNDGDEAESDDPPELIHLDESDNEFVSQ